jgi:hypothetical protein
MMRAAVHVNHAAHQRTHAEAIAAGLRRHGVEVEFAPFNAPVPCDLAVTWGVRQARVMTAAPRTLVMERGYAVDRFRWTACGFDGLNGRANFAKAQGRDDRLKKLYREGLRVDPHRAPKPDGWALIAGQVPGDASLLPLADKGGFAAWAAQAAATLKSLGLRVAYRPHPVASERGSDRPPPGAELLGGGLAEDFAAARVVVTFNSNLGVDAALAGVPVIADDDGSMARLVATNDVRMADVAPPPFQSPAYGAWLRDLAYAQWTLDEIAAGEAWAELAPLLERAAA